MRLSCFQAHHQSLDSGFVGLIVSCFNGDQVIKCTAFQSTMDVPRDPFQEAESSKESPEDVDDEMKKALSLSLQGTPLSLHFKQYIF